MRTASLHNDHGLFALLELDNNLQLAESLGLDVAMLDNLRALEEVHRQLSVLSKEVTGFILDPIYSFHLLGQLPATVGTALRLEQDRPRLPTELPSLFPNFSLEEIKNNYALVKLALTYHPQEEQALAKKQLLAEIREYSRSLGIDFVLKLRVPAMDQDGEGGAADAAAPQLTTIQELHALADLFVLETPHEPLAVATISSELDAPWLVMPSVTDTYESFKEHFRMAMENGASGYCVGQLLWQELASCRGADQSLDLATLQRYIATVLRDRIIELNRIASEGMDARGV